MPHRNNLSSRLVEAAASLNRTTAHLDEILQRQPPLFPRLADPIPVSAPADLRAAPDVRLTALEGEGSPLD